MNPQRSIEYLAGFLMGLFLGFGLNGLFYLYNFICRFFNCTQVKVVWWVLLPLTIIMGLFMSKAIADLHLEDY